MKQYDLDGVDVDYEVIFSYSYFCWTGYRLGQDFNAMNAGDGKAEQWLITFTTALRAQLPQGTYILTHAREFPFPLDSSDIEI